MSEEINAYGIEFTGMKVQSFGIRYLRNSKAMSDISNVFEFFKPLKVY